MNTDMIYGFLDESPSLHDKAYFFCVEILLTDNPHSKELQTIIKRARAKLPAKQKIKLPELKFANTLPKIRNYVLQSLAKHPVKIVALVVETDSRRVEDIPENYGLIVGWVLVEGVEIHPAITLTLDRKFIKPSDVEDMEKTATKIVFDNSPKVMIKLIEGDSKRNSMLQLADFVAGALNAKYNDGDDSYWKLIKDLFEVEKVAKWTSLKAAAKRPSPTKKE